MCYDQVTEFNITLSARSHSHTHVTSYPYKYTLLSYSQSNIRTNVGAGSSIIFTTQTYNVASFIYKVPLAQIFLFVEDCTYFSKQLLYR